MAGRTKFDPLTRRRVLEALESGLPQTLACAQVGISTDTLARWRSRDAAFAAELKEAEARRAQGLVQHIVRAAPKSWQAAAWLLERLHAAEYGRHLLAAPEAAYDEATIRQFALERGLEPDALVAAVAQAQAAQQAARSAGRPANAPIPLHAHGARFQPVNP